MYYMYIDIYVCVFAGNVYATDAILALLMASPRSVYSWDITIEKTNGILFLDKRENSLFDFLTVSETAREPPQVCIYIFIYEICKSMHIYIQLNHSIINHQYHDNHNHSCHNRRLRILMRSITQRSYLLKPQ
jgi:hypothetical protein